MVDEIGFGKTFISVAAAILCKLVAEQVVMGLPLPIVWGNTLEEWVMLGHSNFLGIVGEEREWYPPQRFHSVPRRLLEIQSTLPHGHPAQIPAIERILVLTMPGVGASFENVSDEMTHGTDFKLVNILHANYTNLTHKALNTGIDEPEHPWNILLVS